MKHTTKDGAIIDLKNLELSHLKNIIAMIERKAKLGISVGYGGGVYSDDIWYDEEFLTGEEALKHMNYYKYINELNRRNKLTAS